MAQELIGSKTKGFRLRRGSYSLGGSRATTSLDQYVPLQAQLAFNRKDISGRTYKDIVDRAIQTAPGAAQRVLLVEQSKAIERAQTEERKLRQLQAEVKAASSPGKTLQDAIDLYNFWSNEATNAFNEGDQEYALTALKNAGNARDLAQTKATTEGNKAQSQQTKAIYNQWQTEDNGYKQNINQIENYYQKGLITGKERDNELVAAYSVRATTLEDRKRYLAELENQGINSLGAKDIQTLVETYSTDLSGNVTASGSVTPGLYDLVGTTAERIQSGKWGDFVEPTFKDIMGEKVQTGFKVTRAEVPTDTRGFIRDDYGRFIPLQSQHLANGNVVLFADIPDPNGGVRQIRSNEIVPGQAKTIQELMQNQTAGRNGKNPIVFSTEDGRKLYDLGYTGLTDTSGRLNVFNLDNTNLDKWASEVVGADQASIERAKQYKYTQPQAQPTQPQGLIGQLKNEVTNAPNNILKALTTKQPAELAPNFPIAPTTYLNAPVLPAPLRLPSTPANTLAAPAPAPIVAPNLNISKSGGATPAPINLSGINFNSAPAPTIYGPVNPASTALANDIKNWPKGFTFPSFVEKYASQLPLNTIYSVYNANTKYGPPKESYQEVAARYTRAGGKL